MDARSLLADLLNYGKKSVSLETQPLTGPETAAEIAVGFTPGLGTAQSARDLVRAAKEGDPVGMGLSGAGLIPFLGGVVKSAKATKLVDLLRDWKWRPEKAVAKDIGLDAVPDYVQKGYGQFMKEQAGRAARGELGTDDLLKAYGITRSSVSRAGRDITDDLVSGPTRPEGYMAEWLRSGAGKDYLGAAREGVADPAAINDIVRRFQPFGMADTLGKDLAYGAQTLAPRTAELGAAITGPLDQWRGFAQSLEGIGPAKSGFLASLLGRGDLPTLDARQLRLHAGNTAEEAGKFMRRRGGAGGDQAVDRLARRQQALALALDPSLEPFYQHLTHHTVWDKVGKSQTTHDDLVRAMRE
jgi:hypothetical protein